MQTKVLPVIHYESDEQVLRNAQIAVDAGCAGVFLIHMDGEDQKLSLADRDIQARKRLSPVTRDIKTRWPNLLVGINYLGMCPAEAVRINIEDGFDMTWTDAQLSHSRAAPWGLADRVRAAQVANVEHLVFAGVAFKHQRDESHPEHAAVRAHEFGFIPTTSGPATGVAAEVRKIASMRQALGAAPLAIASGITPENVREFAPHLTHVLVATGVSSSFYEFDFEKLYQVRALCDNAQQ